MSERYDDTERRLSAALQAMASEAPAPAGLWARVASRLDELGTARAWWRGRWTLLAAGSAAAVVLAFGGVGIAQLATGMGSEGQLLSMGSNDQSDAANVRQELSLRASSSAFWNLVDNDADREARESVTLQEARQAAEPRAVPTAPPRAPTETLSPIPAPSGPSGPAGMAGMPGAAPEYQVVDGERQVISQASLDVEVSDVSGAVTQLRSLVESVGGFLEHVSTSGGPDPQRASAVVRVPSERFLNAMERIERLGKARGQSLGQQDVTGEVIDLEARLRSELRTEESLLELLDRAVSVSDVLTVERELSRVRASVERLQGQIEFISKSVALATIEVSFSLPPDTTPSAPTASLQIEVEDVEGAVRRIQDIVGNAGGTMGQVTVVLNPNGAEAFLSSRVPAPAFESVLASATVDSVVLHQEIRRAGLQQDTPDEDLVARVEMVLQSPQAASRWLTVGLPVGGALVLLLIAGVAVVAYRRGRRV